MDGSACSSKAKQSAPSQLNDDNLNMGRHFYPSYEGRSMTLIISHNNRNINGGCGAGRGIMPIFSMTLRVSCYTKTVLK